LQKQWIFWTCQAFCSYHHLATPCSELAAFELEQQAFPSTVAAIFIAKLGLVELSSPFFE
jgi:hypothetical protein